MICNDMLMLASYNIAFNFSLMLHVFAYKWFDISLLELLLL